MRGYIYSVMGLKFLVDFLLLLGAGRFFGYPVRISRVLVAAALGGVYAGACLLPDFYFLGNLLWRGVSFAAMAVIAYGFSVNALRMGLFFSFLCVTMSGAVLGMGKGGAVGVISAAGVLFLLCSFGFQGRIGGTRYIPVELNYGGKKLCLTALQDTGNTLRDPITGRQVLIIGAEAAQELTGLTVQQLRTPVESIHMLPGLRLIPYNSIGNSGLLLALRLQNVKIGVWQGDTLVAFAPHGLSREGAYQALTGGAL